MSWGIPPAPQSSQGSSRRSQTDDSCSCRLSFGPMRSPHPGHLHSCTHSSISCRSREAWGSIAVQSGMRHGTSRMGHSASRWARTPRAVLWDGDRRKPLVCRRRLYQDPTHQGSHQIIVRERSDPRPSLNARTFVLPFPPNPPRLYLAARSRRSGPVFEGMRSPRALPWLGTRVAPRIRGCRGGVGVGRPRPCAWRAR